MTVAFDPNILRPILRKKAERRAQLERDAKQRQREIYEKIPRIDEIDRELRTTPIEIVRAAFSHKKDASSQIRAVRAHNLELQEERRALLVSTGYACDYMEVHYDCAECEDTGYITPGEPCVCLREAYGEEQLKELLKVVSVGRETFEAFNTELYPKDSAHSCHEQMCQIYDYCIGYTKHFGPGAENLLFNGGPGLGKTLLASCIAIEVAKRGFGVVYGSAFEILGAFEDKKFNRDSEIDITEKYFSCDLLIIDDFGSEMMTAFTVAAFQNLINSRVLSGKKTIVVSGLTMEEIARKYNAQIASRLRGDFIQLAFCGQDIRELKRKQ